MELIDALCAISPISKESCDRLLEIILEIIRERQLPKGYILLDFNHIDSDLHFIVKGSGRVYYLKDGRDVTDYIAMDGHFLGGVESLFTRERSYKAMELTEDSTVQSFRYASFEALCDTCHDLERAGRKMAIFAFLECQKRIESIRFLNAAERYHQLEKKYPGITNRIPLKHIASYLGTTQVSISRIRGGRQ